MRTPVQPLSRSKTPSALWEAVVSADECWLTADAYRLTRSSRRPVRRFSVRLRDTLQAW